MNLSSELLSQLAKITNDNKDNNTETFVYGIAKHINGKLYVKLDGAGDGVLTPVYTTADVKDGEQVTVMIKNHTATVIGNMSSPAARTEDVKNLEERANSGAVNAAKVATNYISYNSEDGLQIGNKASGSWSGFRTQITAEAFNILDAAGNVLASYGAKLIELGKNAADAIISICGGKGRIEYDSDEEYLQVTGDKLRLNGATEASLYSNYYDGESTGKRSGIYTSSDQIYMYSTTSSNIDPETMVGVWTTSSLTITPWEIYMLSDSIHEISRYGSTYETVSGDITLKPAGVVDIKKRVYISTGEKTEYNDGIAGWYFGTDGTAHATHVTKGPAIGFHYAGSTDATSLIEETAPGVISINGMNFGVNKILWNGTYYMTADHKATLSEAISKQPIGIVLTFSEYADGAALDNNFNHFFVPKAFINELGGYGSGFTMMDINFGCVCHKYLYIHDTYISGHANNTATGTGTSGITYANNKYVLRYVFGV